MLPELIEVLTTTAERSDAERLATLLVEKRLAACTQISGPIESRYWWNDCLQTTQEWQVVAKTRGDAYANVEAAILAAHPYEQPEVIAIPLPAVSAGYRAWLLGQLSIPPKPAVETPTEAPDEAPDEAPVVVEELVAPSAAASTEAPAKRKRGKRRT